MATFFEDVVEARKLWGQRDSWVRDSSGTCAADRIFNGLAWSAAHEGMFLGSGPGGEWSDAKQAAFEAAQLDYERRSMMTLGLGLLAKFHITDTTTPDSLRV